MVVTEPTDRLADLTNKIPGAHPIKTQIISRVNSKARSRRLNWGNRGVVYQHDPGLVDVFVKDLRLEHGNPVQTPAVRDVSEEEPEPLDQT